MASISRGNSVTTIALMVGDVTTLASSAREMLIALRYFAERDTTGGNIIIVVDGVDWLEWLNCQPESPSTIARTSIVAMTAATHLPGRMVNRALDLVTTGTVGIVAIGCEISTWFANQAALHDALSARNTQIAAGYRGQGETRNTKNESFLVHQSDQFSSDYPHAWLQMLDLVPMSNCLVNTAFVRRLGGFSEAREMQSMWWWEFTLRASRYQMIASLSLQPVPATSWHRYPFATSLAKPVDANLSALMRIGSERGRVLPMRPDEFSAMPTPSQNGNAVQSESWRNLPENLRRTLLAKADQKGGQLKIAVLGGVNEPAHNQLCFFNYFAMMRDWGVLTWRSLLDERATLDDLADCDLVIFSRIRSDNGVALVKACAARQIRTIYMLDDNWFWIGREWAEYAAVFAPGKPPFENFLTCIRHADITLTYSEPLAEDLRPFAKRVTTLPTNVDLRMFPTSTAHERINPAMTVIGFVGSLRKNMLAFDALVDIATRRNDVVVFVMSNSLPAEFSALSQSQVHFEPYQFSYESYAATVMRNAPQILVAPVGRSRFEESKCPNKYLEISACGAAGVYTRAKPYLSCVIDGETGVFADDTIESWVTAIERLIDSPELRNHIATEAHRQVANQYATSAVLPKFVQMLVDAL